MRSLLALLIFGISGVANATIIRVDTQGEAIRWEFGTPMPSAVNLSMLLDTAGHSGNFGTVVNSDGTACIGHFDASFAGQILSVAADGVSVLSGIAGVPGKASAGGDTPAFCQPNQQFYFGGLSINSDSYNLLFSYDSRHPISHADLTASTDPLATLLLSGQLAGFGTLNLVTPLGQGVIAVGQLSFSELAEVPEPSTWMLLLLGLGGLAVSHRRRTSNQALS